MFEDGARKSRQLAAYLETIAERHGAGFLDAGAVAEVDPVDGIHLDEVAHRKMGSAVADAVIGLMPE